KKKEACNSLYFSELCENQKENAIKIESRIREEKKMEGGGEGEVERVEDSKDLQQQSKAFDKLTDRVEDRQLDSTRVQEAMASIAASSEADWNAMRLREKELAAVKINAADVDIIANELELDKKVAERTLREHKGDAVAAIRHLLH
ncbi:DNA-binding enhancer protein-related protein, partial [Prunus dulcis]